MSLVKSNCWAFSSNRTFIPENRDIAIELVDHENGKWEVILPDDFDCPEGFERLYHYSDDLYYYGKTFESLEEALKEYNKLFKKFYYVTK